MTTADLFHLLREAVRDTLPMVPVLFLLYGRLEFFSHGGGFRLLARSRTAGALGPLAGALLGVIPQCGMSVFMTSLFLANRVSAGTLVATYLATSDEALPVLISHGDQGRAIAAILGIKVALALAVGFGLDATTGSAHVGPRPRSRSERPRAARSL